MWPEMDLFFSTQSQYDCVWTSSMSLEVWKEDHDMKERRVVERGYFLKYNKYIENMMHQQPLHHPTISIYYSGC